MRFAALGSLLFAGLVIGVVGIGLQHSRVFAQRPQEQSSTGVRPSDQLIALASDAGQGHQQVTVIDPKIRVMSVYHIDLATGEIALKSVRHIHWDMQMEDFNGVSPTPRDIRSLLQHR